MTALRVAVVMGGTSAEREVSLRSGTAVMSALDPNCYEAIACIGEPDGTWTLAGECVAPEELGAALKRRGAGVVFIALHGPGGEDGKLQSLFDICNIPYTGSGAAASAVAMDKIFTRAVLEASGLRCAPAVIVNEFEWRSGARDNITDRAFALGAPLSGASLFVKAPTQGSSFGVTKVDINNTAALPAAIDHAFQFGPRILIERGIAGVEVTVPILGNANDLELFALAPVEIRPKQSAFFDYNEKYSASGAEEICPPRSLTKERVAEISKYGERAHRALQCDGMSRTDMIVTENEVFILEVNTIPGLTERSLLPQSAAASGIPFPELVSRIIQFALRRFRASS
ncbi:MAG: D-alanine--D-alanine ligase [Planctomycetota bacterium]